MKNILAIAVIAVLMSACQSNTKNENSNTPVSGLDAATGSETVAPASDMPATNPAHGMPYHDCSLAVGAPLVAKEPVNPAELNKPVVLNPEHGLPGHRCDIAVGAPLN